MGLRTSTGKGTRLRHSTGLEWDELEKARKKNTPIIHSTGEDSKIRHSTGTEMDYRALRGEPEDDEAETRPEPRLHSVPAKAGEDTKYLDLYAQSMRKKALAQRDDTIVGSTGKQRKEEKQAPESEASKGGFKSVAFDY